MCRSSAPDYSRQRASAFFRFQSQQRPGFVLSYRIFLARRLPAASGSRRTPRSIRELTRVVPLFRESHARVIGARRGPSFTHSICVLSAAGVAGGINIESWSVRLCRDQHVITVDVDVGRGRPSPVETHRIHSPHPFLLAPELDLSRSCGWCRRWSCGW